ncbi:MAG: cellulase family glycosylhydrolase [Pirellulaceae bacterium]
MVSPPRPSELGYRLVLVVALLAGRHTLGMDAVRIAPDQKHFVLVPSGERFVPWGHNYGSVDLLGRLAQDPDRVRRDFADMKAAGTTVARVHPEMPALLLGPDRANPQALERLRQLLAIAEESGIYLHITGLACYQIKDRMEWYDALDNSRRWQVQEFFWSTIAETCKASPAVFCYDLVNEPAASAKQADGWYTGRMGEVEFCQRLVLDQPNRTGDDIFRDWTGRMVAAIRKHDPKRLTTLGMLPFPGAYKAAAEQLDFVSPHLYPKTKGVTAEIELLRKFDFGKPIVIGETFPLSCSAAEEREFLLESRGLAQGWIGHWPDETPEQLRELKEQSKITIAQSIWLSWVELFRDVGPDMTR